MYLFKYIVFSVLHEENMSYYYSDDVICFVLSSFLFTHS